MEQVDPDPIGFKKSHPPNITFIGWHAFVQEALKPDSVPSGIAPLSSMAIRLGVSLPIPSSGLIRVSACEQQDCETHLDLSPGGVCPARFVSKPAVRSYRTISNLPAFALRATAGGIFSVALSFKSP